MEMTELIPAISTVGFPIVSYLISAWFVKYTYDKQLERDKINDERNEEHWKQLAELTAAVSNNSEAIKELVGELHAENN